MRFFLKLGIWPSALGVALMVFSYTQVAHSQQSGAGELEISQIRPNFFVIFGAGGNIAVQVGANGVVMVNTGTIEAADRVLQAVKEISDQPIRYIINTGANPDDVGGNGVLSKAGRNILGPGPATILAAQPVLFRMSAPNGKIAPFPEDAWPTETFNEPRKDLYLNQEGIFMYRDPGAGTDGNSVVLFRGSDIVVTGQVVDTTRFPLIETEKGGTIQGEIDALNHILDLSVRPLPYLFQGGGTVIVPGRGRLYDYFDLVDYRDMVVAVRDNVADMIHRGTTLPEIKAARPAKAYERRYGATSGPWTTDDFVEAIYRGLTAKEPKK